MDGFMDFVMEKILFPVIILIGIIAGLALAFIGYHILHEAWHPSPTFELRVDGWKCTKHVTETYTTLVPVGKVLVPLVNTTPRCVQWSANE